MNPLESPEMRKSLNFLRVIILPFLCASICYRALVARFHPLNMPLSKPTTKKS